MQTKMVPNHRSNNKVDKIALKACGWQPIKRLVPVLRNGHPLAAETLLAQEGNSLYFINNVC